DWAREALEAGSRPSLPKNLDSVRSAAARIEKIFDELAVLLEGTPAGTDMARTDLDELEQRLEALHRDRQDLTTLPRRTELLRRLELDGLGELVEDLRLRRVSADQVGPELELSWWRSVLELIAGANRPSPSTTAPPCPRSPSGSAAWTPSTWTTPPRASMPRPTRSGSTP